VRRLATGERIRAFLDRLGQRTTEPATVYLTGGATAVVMGWRDATIDIHLKLVPDRDELLRLIPRLKEELEINVELASPDMFIPVRHGWEDRSPWESTVGRIVVRHFDMYAQALAKIERGHSRDLSDVAEMLRRGLVTPSRLMAYFEAVEPYLFRYPAVDPISLRRRVEDRVAEA
jgi:hypothetical protein